MSNQHHRHHIASDQPPGPDRYFPLGPGEETRTRLEHWFRQYGDVCRIPPGPEGHASWVIHDPDAIRHVLYGNSRNYTKGIGLERVRILLGNGIMVSEGDFWHRQRRMLQPGFHRRALQTHIPMIIAENRLLLERWQTAARNGETVDVTTATSELSLAIILRAIFGPDFEALYANGGNPFALLTEESRRDLKFAARFRALTSLVREIVDRRRARGVAENDLPADFLDWLLSARDRKSGEAMNDKALIDEVMTLIVAGHETTASVLAWMWYLLAQNPDVADQLADYLADMPVDRWVESCAGEKQETGFGSRACLAGQVVRETLRLYPPGWLFSRRPIEDDEIAGFPVSAGSQVFICPWITHGHPGYWRNPQQFHPQRFGGYNPEIHLYPVQRGSPALHRRADGDDGNNDPSGHSGTENAFLDLRQGVTGDRSQGQPARG